MLSADGLFEGHFGDGDETDGDDEGDGPDDGAGEETEEGRDRPAPDVAAPSDQPTSPSLGVRVLDLYAGSGALAFEALSRGASSAVLVEQARDAVAVIRENVRALGAEATIILALRVDRALTQVDGPFELVFADPPYADVRTPAFAAILAGAAGLVAPGGVFVLEHASKDASPTISGLTLDRSRRHGDTTLSLYRASRPV